MIESATGLVLRTRLLTETSLIVHWLTRDSGRIATVAKGARGAKSPFRGKLDLFYLADFSFSRSRHSELHALREVSLRETHSFFRQELGYLQQASYCAMLAEQTTETDTPLPAIFELMSGFLQALPQSEPHPKTVLAFELRLLSQLGLKPDLAQSRLTAGAKEIVRRLGQDDWGSISRLKPSTTQLTDLRQFLHGFLTYHLGKVPKGRGTVLEVHDPITLREPPRPVNFSA